MHIWFIEDDEQLSELIAEGLRILGHEVLTFPDLVGLRERLAAKQPDLLLLDLELGARNAADLIPFIHSKYPELYLIVASSHSDGEEIAKCYDAGIQAYIKKPYDIRELDCIMRRLPVRGESAFAQVHADTYYLRAHALYRGNHEIQRLPDVEYRILRQLIARRGTVVTKEELCQSIWGEPNLDDRLNTAISRLRKLLPADCPWVLENQKRVGYSLTYINYNSI